MTLDQLLSEPIKAKFNSGKYVNSLSENIRGLLALGHSRRIAVPKQEYADMLIGYFIVLGLQPDIIVDDSVDFIYRRLKGVP